MDSQQQRQPAATDHAGACSSIAKTDNSDSDSDKLPEMFRPPVNRAMRVLDRSFFRKTIPLSAATVFENSNISRVRNALGKSHDLLALPRLNVIRPVPTTTAAQTVEGEGEGETGKKRKLSGEERKCLLLREGIKYDGGYCPRLCAVGRKRV
jgi:hypothetical protein